MANDVRVRAAHGFASWRAIVLTSALAGCTGQVESPSQASGASPTATSTSGSAAAPSTPVPPGSPTTPGTPGTSNPQVPAPSQPDEPAPAEPSGGTDELATTCASFNGQLNVGTTRLRRLTRSQFNNTVRDLIGATGDPAASISPDERIGPFNSNAIAPITSLIVEQHMEVAKLLAADAVTRQSTLSPCDLAADVDATCASQFVAAFGLRAFRRPLSTDEVSDYLALYRVGAEAGAQNGFRLVVEAMLQSPFFLYHVDVGTSGVPSATPVALAPYEVAARLSYFLWNSLPDGQLFDAASAGSLSEPATIRTQVDRMLKDARAGDTIGLFHRQWLGLEDLAAREKDTAAFPEYNADLAALMLKENAVFADYVIRQGEATLSQLLTADFGFPEGGLFGVYGVAQPSGFTPGTKVAFDPAQRAGILTQAALMSRNAHRDQTSPILRGIVIRENVLCQTLEPPPVGVVTTPPSFDPATSTRERYAQHVADPTCAGCHALIDPMGLAFENYDPIGKYRTMDGLGPVDASGNATAVAQDLAGPFANGVELAKKFAKSRQVADCLANQWFRFSLGRIESRDDACSIRSIHDGFSASGGNIRLLLAEIAASQAFRSVRANMEEN